MPVWRGHRQRRKRLETKLESSQSELGKSKAELDKAASEVGRSGADWEAAKQRMARLELENEKLRHDIDRQSTYGKSTLNSSQEMDRIQDRAEKAAAELRRAQTELRVTQAENERARAEAAALQEKVRQSIGTYYHSGTLHSSTLPYRYFNPEIETFHLVPPKGLLRSLCE